MPKLLNIQLIFFISIILAACSQASSSSARTTSTLHYEKGKASFYANKFQGRRTASGQRFNQSARTAAHKKLPFGTRVKVTNRDNGKSVVVSINDRGPYIKGRIIDLSKSAFSAIANTRLGVIDVIVEVIR